MHKITNRALRNQPLRMPEGRVMRVIIADHGFHAVLARGLFHRARLIQRQRERLFAMHMFARLNCRQRHLIVKRVGAGDRDDIDLLSADHCAPIGCGMLKAKLICHLVRKIVRLIAKPHQPHLWQIAEDRPRRTIRERMGLAHVTRSD